ncbi:MFS transporter [Chloroflexota bacterium]
MHKSVQEGETVNSNLRLVHFISTNKPFIALWLAMFIAIAGIAMVTPLMPVFAKEMGASGIWLGFAFSGFAFTQIPLMPVMGKLADKFGKKFFIWFGLLIFTMISIGYYWAPGFRELVLFRVLGGVGSAMVIPIAFSYIGELSPRGHEGRYMGLFTISLIAGFGIGPMAGGVLFDSFGMDATFVSMGILSLLGAAVAFIFLPGRKSSQRVAASSGTTEFKEPSSSFRTMLGDTTVQGILTIQLVFHLFFGTLLAFIGIWMTTVLKTTVAQVGIAMSVRAIINGVFAYPFGWLADRMNRAVIASVGMILMAICTFSIPWLGSFAPLLGLFMVMGVFESMTIPSINAINVEKGRSMGMGSIMGVFNMAGSLGLVVGSMVGGVIENSLGLVAVFRFTAGLGLVGVFIFNIFMIKSGRFPRNFRSVLQTGAQDLVFDESAAERDD